MDPSPINSNQLFAYILENSSFTAKQASIIFNRLRGPSRLPGMTSGAYFRQVKQCREKIYSTLYSAVLLQSTGVLEDQGLVALSQVADQMRVIFSSDARDIFPPDRMEGVMSVMSQLVKRVSRL